MARGSPNKKTPGAARLPGVISPSEHHRSGYGALQTLKFSRKVSPLRRVSATRPQEACGELCAEEAGVGFGLAFSRRTIFSSRALLLETTKSALILSPGASDSASLGMAMT